jgi:hypothetical protein
MTEKYCDKKNPLARNGISVPERMPLPLKDEYVRIDERTISDFLIFIDNYSRQIKYYNLINKHFGQWNDFFSSDVSVLIAKIAGKRTLDYRPYFSETLDILSSESESLTNTDDLPGKIPTLKNLFDFMFSLMFQMDQEIYYLPEEFPFKELAAKTIQKDFSASFVKLIGIYKAGVDLGLINPSQKIVVVAEPPAEMVFAQDFINRGVDGMWFANQSQSLEDYFQSLDPLEFHGHYKAPAAPFSVQDVRFMLDTISKQLSDIFDKALKTIGSVIDKAMDFLHQTITQWPDHKPHMAMLISFLHLYDILREQLNGLGTKHLEFYYKDVLRIKNKKAEPSLAHLIIELAKNTSKLTLPKGTMYKAGKDENGKDILFEQTGEFSINKAAVAQLKGILRPEGIFSATPVLKSIDGLGEEPVKENVSWSPFGTVHLNARIGFAIASPMLFLQEGHRAIRINLHLEESIPAISFTKNDFTAQITLEKQWSEPLALSSLELEGGNKIVMAIAFSPDDPAVFPFDPKFHVDPFNVESPVIKIKLNDAAANYAKLQDLRITKVELKVDVKGIKNLVVQNNLGSLDPSKPFMPFGPQPAKGASLIVGSNEVFQKPLKNLSLFVEWDGLPDENLYTYFGIEDSIIDDIAKTDNQFFKATISILKESKWQIATENINKRLFSFADMYSVEAFTFLVFHWTALLTHLVENGLFNVYDEEVMLENTNGWNRIKINTSLVSPRLNNFSYQHIGNFDIHKKTGYIKLELGKPDFGHKDYPVKYTQAVVDFAKKPAGETLIVPNPPYTPMIKLLTLDYEAEDTLDLSVNPESNTGQFFHIHPFGVAEAGKAGAVPPILPQYEKEGETYVGLENVSPGQFISLLFQLDEGSANPLKELPEIQWSYLSSDQWHAFDRNKGEVIDETINLIQSGIVRFKVPEKVDLSNSLLPEKLFWISANVEKNQDAVSRVIDVLAQAVHVRLVMDGDRDSMIQQQLPAGSIAKMVQRDADVKAIAQPFATYNGKPTPPRETFNLSVSERLRHKNRAIAIWDYERLVLENFPEIFKVRCLNHTSAVEKSGSIRDYERFPGHVTVIVIPRINDKTSFYLDRPYASMATLNKIKDYIKAKTSPFVQLQVMNPKFEPVQVELDVAFYEDKDPDVYKEILNKDLKEFLSPWAFEAAAITQMRFGGSIQKSVILKYIEDRSYVDFITDFKVYHYVDENDPGTEVEEAVASTARSILVSYENHKINQSVSCDV